MRHWHAAALLARHAQPRGHRAADGRRGVGRGARNGHLVHRLSRQPLLIAASLHGFRARQLTTDCTAADAHDDRRANWRALRKARLAWDLSSLLLSQPLHFGDYGGLPLKVIWTFLGLITSSVLASGPYL
ncbi:MULTISPECIES: PepSY domain-containing protein [unclassified Variovorax]|uniref:PepSY domain-containing protein n=1 Tax=Variovorax TaxID=34072 RepID=UPI00147765E3